ncbi:SRPBCC domain-containing protein [Agromyces sp. ISL-38]|uniref:SRPBCC family protein n=1 Tax=Agromyces sp. ISL-38 TaxID=2819107 RepID=UPI001BE73BCE|nr:SRPBCC domain-containing protein [Agromyces sp. ISL-38]MBT2500057.1 SRPBCC domain-containing protein [Agromyces sp. ISL-38]MBT2518778.1 SRPBCC domain-containing protein [Streptomyces sp. ISL-90]
MAEFSTSIDIHATPEVVFDYLVTPAGMTAWMGETATLEPSVGGTFSVDIAGSPIRGQYLEVVRPHRVVVSWGVAGSDELPSGASRVSFTLTPIGEGTRVELLHSDLPDVHVEGHVDGWQHFLPRLASAAQGQPPAADGWIPLPQRDGSTR